MDFWRLPVKIFRRDIIGKTVIKQQMKVTRYYSQTANILWTCPQNGRGKIGRTSLRHSIL